MKFPGNGIQPANAFMIIDREEPIVCRVTEPVRLPPDPRDLRQAVAYIVSGSLKSSEIEFICLCRAIIDGDYIVCQFAQAVEGIGRQAAAVFGVIAERPEFSAIVPAESIHGAQPDKTIGILNDPGNITLRKTVFHAKMLLIGKEALLPGGGRRNEEQAGD